MFIETRPTKITSSGRSDIIPRYRAMSLLPDRGWFFGDETINMSALTGFALLPGLKNDPRLTSRQPSPQGEGMRSFKQLAIFAA